MRRRLSGRGLDYPTTSARNNSRIRLLGSCAAAASLAAAIALSALAQPKQSESRPQHEVQRESLVDNQFVSIERLTFPPNNQGFAISRENTSSPTLVLRFRPAQPDTTSSDSWRFENMNFFPPEAPRPNLPPSASPFRLIDIHLRDQPESSPFADDAVKLDPRHNEVLLENNRVRVVRIHFPPGESGPIVDKRTRIIIALTDSHATVTRPDGQTGVRDAKAGSVNFSNGGRQSTNNIGTTLLENIVVELKNK
jgi:hypothetical protein